MSALQIALQNCTGLGTPIVALGHQAARVRRAVPRGVPVVLNRGWRSGQLGSLLAGLRRLPPDAPFILYPVDYPLLTSAILRRLVAGFEDKRKWQTIIVPVFRGRQGHPVIFAPELQGELATAQTAKEVVCRDERRVKFVPVGTPAIWQDFGDPTSYRQRRRDYEWCLTTKRN